MKKAFILAFFCLLLCPVAVRAYEPASAEILYGTPTIDGLADDIYRQSYSVKMTGKDNTFHTSMGAEENGSENDYAIAYYLYDKNNLYVCVVAYDDDLMTMGEDYINNWLTTKDDLPWRNDAVEVRIAFLHNPSLIFQTDAYGFYTVCYQNKHSAKHSVAVTRGKNHFIAEFSIPLINGEQAGDKIGVTIEIDDVHNTSGSFNAYGSQKPVENQVTLSEKKAEFFNPFSDVSVKDWYYGSAIYASQSGIIAGSYGLFLPNDHTTRGMLVTMLWRIEGMPEAASAPFPDVAANTWYAKAAAWAYQNNIVTGMQGGLFAPERPVTREELAAILYRYTQYKGKKASEPKKDQKPVDLKDVSDWAKTYVDWSLSEGLLLGDSANRIRPRENITRAETAAVWMRYMTSFNAVS